MNEGLAAELEFWKEEYAKYEGQDYAAIRSAQYSSLSRFFPHIFELEGTDKEGLDLGCGLVSMFEGADLNMWAVDPLLEEYQKIYEPENPTVNYDIFYQDGGDLPYLVHNFDYVFCINVIDHTKHHKKLLSEVYRVLEPGGLFFLMVNFEPALVPPNHIMCWDSGIVSANLVQFKLLHGVVCWWEEEQKYQYWGTYQKSEIPSW